MDLRKLALLQKIELNHHHSKFAVDAETIRNTIITKIKNSLANASTRPEKSGIIPFTQMIEQDEASLSLTIIRNGNDISISEPSINKPELLQKYLPLSKQVKQYLEQNLELFPTKINGEAVEYNNFTFQVVFP
jgi:hypothetical protein